MPILWSGAIEFLSPDAQTFAFIRTNDQQRLLCVFNMSDQASAYTLPENCVVLSPAKVPQSSSAEQIEAMKNTSTPTLQLSPWQTLFAWVDTAKAK